MRRLCLPATVVQQLREELLQDDEQERFAFLYCGQTESALLASEVQTVPDEAMARQSAAACRPAAEVERAHIQTCYDNQLVPVLTHSHPFAVNANFSSRDIESMDQFRDWLQGLFPENSFGFAVLGQEDIDALVTAESRFESLGIEVIGEWKLETPIPGSRTRFEIQETDAITRDQQSGDDRVLPDSEDQEQHESQTKNHTDKRDRRAPSETSKQDHFDRNRRALGDLGQQRLRELTVGIVGVGGLGSIVAEQLCRLGVKHIVLVDDDVVEKSNLSRLVGAYGHHVGKPKVDVIQEHLWRSAPDEVMVDAIQARVQECDAKLDGCDIVVGCVDTVTARSYCNEYAVKQLQYFVDVGVRIDAADEQAICKTGYIHLVAPGSTACFDCLGRHNQDATRLERLSPQEAQEQRRRGYVDDEELAPEPALVHLNGLCASKTVSVVVDLATGYEPPDFLRYEDHTHELTELTTSPSDSCTTCGEDGVLGVSRREFGDAEFTPDELATESD